MKLVSRLLAAAGALALAAHPALAVPQSVAPPLQLGTTSGTAASGNDSRFPMLTPFTQAPKAAGNGTTDDSQAVAAMCAAAVARGDRAALMPAGTYYAPNLGPGACANVILTGSGVLTGAYRKKVIPLTAPGLPSPARTIPASSLARFKAAVAAATTSAPALVCIMGDSTSLTTSNMLAASESLWDRLQAKIRAEYPTAPIVFQNYGIAGQTFATMIAKPSTFPAWYTDQTKNWITYVQGATAGSTTGCDLLVINSGINDGSSLAYGQLLAYTYLVSQFAKTPSLLWVTPGVPTLNQGVSGLTGYSDQASQDGRDYAAGFVRSYAVKNNWGLLDMHRRMVLVRDGYDVLEQQLYRVGTDAAFVQQDYTAAVQTYDFALNVNLPYGFQNGGTTAITFPLSSAPGNNLVLDRDGSSGNIAYTVNGDAQYKSIARTVSAVPIAVNGLVNVEVSVKGSTLVLMVNSVEVYNGPIDRAGGLMTPAMTSTGTGLIRSAVVYSASKPKVFMPLLTDAEMYGTSFAGIDGNSVNHGTSAKIQNVDAAVLAAQSFGGQ